MLEPERQKTPVFDIYFQDLELDEKSISDGKRVLDLGAGTAMFAADGRRSNCWIYSLDADESAWLPIKNEMLAAKRRGLPSSELDLWREVFSVSTVANMIRLPFSDGSFEVIVSRYGFPQAIESLAEMEMALAEVARILAPGGEARFFPFATDRWSGETREMAFKSLEFLVKMKGVWVEIKEKELKQPWGPIEQAYLLTIRKFEPRDNDRLGIGWAK